MSSSLSILVAFASARGSTGEIAGFIANRLRLKGFDVDLCSVDQAPNPRHYDVVVVGSAIHDRAWLPDAERFLRRHRVVLQGRDVWLFSVGLSPALHGPVGRRLKRAVPKNIASLLELISVREYAVFAGVFSRADTTRVSRIVYRLIGGGGFGDLRDWQAIARWTDGIGAAVSRRGLTDATHEAP
ncbi:flavodoxin domain-containing protein [Antrihabitans sp. YC3-6]|uniref:Flavodoxin domain-containing protein n=1 Tax=Antrihabitans stalagmiti TaxID=2799499 RepID=A0A934NU69_9NOCA|nr:flavodoxin domain-containing protein [Antrihabitans stalagmiti]MBJ8341240.1 flavodoxin domain-containing protein [Antrihabitans stalagmiti]